jgi:hypothetical protein
LISDGVKHIIDFNPNVDIKGNDFVDGYDDRYMLSCTRQKPKGTTRLLLLLLFIFILTLISLSS